MPLEHDYKTIAEIHGTQWEEYITCIGDVSKRG